MPYAIYAIRWRQSDPLASNSRWPPPPLPSLTCDVVAQYPRRYYPPVRREQRLQILLRHVLRQPRHVQVGALDRFRAGPRVRHLQPNKNQTSIQNVGDSLAHTHLDRFVLQPEAVERVDCLLRILRPMVVNEAVAQALTCNKRICWRISIVNITDIYPDTVATYAHIYQRLYRSLHFFNQLIGITTKSHLFPILPYRIS